MIMMANADDNDDNDNTSQLNCEFRGVNLIRSGGNRLMSTHMIVIIN